MRTLVVALAALVGAACSNGPALVGLGSRESPCETDGHCMFGLFCVEVDGDRFCSRACDTAGVCDRGYECDLHLGVCVPDGETCVDTDRRCGPSFGPCCDSECTSLPGLGRYCARACTDDAQCATACCAARPGGGGACVPPIYCEGVGLTE